MPNNTAAVLGSATATLVATTVAAATAPHYGILKYGWTNAEIVAAGTGATTANITIGKLPANSRIVAAYIINDTQATFAAGTLTASVGVAATAYADWVAAASIKATAATIYGNAAAQLGDLAFYGGHARISHVTVCLGGGVTIGANGGNSMTNGDDPRAFVQLQPIRYRADFRGVRRL